MSDPEIQRMSQDGHKRRLLIDTDAGIDDAHAILMALNAPDVEVVAITTCHGNTTVENVYNNVKRLLKMASRQDIPIYSGCSKPILGQLQNSSHYHGIDGFGDVPEMTYARNELEINDEFNNAHVQPEVVNGVGKPRDQEEHSVNAIIRFANIYKGSLTLVTLGPLTNVALALRLDAELGEKLRACYTMGGNYQGKGNVTPNAEFNFYADPEAARVVLEGLSCPLYLVSWELCLQHALSWDFYQRFINKPTKAAAFLKHIEAQTLEKFYKDRRHYIAADQLAMATLLTPEVVMEKMAVSCTVETSSGGSRGMMLVDWDSTGDNLDPKREIQLILCLDQAVFEEVLMTATE